MVITKSTIKKLEKHIIKIEKQNNCSENKIKLTDEQWERLIELDIGELRQIQNKE